MTSVLGGKAAGALNALALVRASGGGQCPCARRFPFRSGLFSYSTLAGARPLIDSLDAASVFEAAAVDCCAYVWPKHRVEGLDLRMDNLVRCIGEGTPYWYPRQRWRPWCHRVAAHVRPSATARAQEPFPPSDRWTMTQNRRYPLGGILLKSP